MTPPKLEDVLTERGAAFFFEIPVHARTVECCVCLRHLDEIERPAGEVCSAACRRELERAEGGS